jgi:nucleotide-binding universal stress UspA family protein
MYQRILVATDGSKLSKKATNSAIALAVLCGAELTVVKVVARYPQSYFEGGMALSNVDVSALEKEWVDVAQAEVDAVKKAAAQRGVQAKAVVVKSAVVSEALLAAAKKHQSDLIVMASHGHKGIKRLLLGSEAQHVLTHSSVPVLILK